MPIQQIQNRVKAPILGTIRLGEKRESKKGNLYPTETEYFVLKDAPDVAHKYGDNPKELDVLFPVDDREIVSPTWLKMYSASIKDSQGNVRYGRLQCRGNGPDPEGNPGTAYHYAKRDPVSKVVPTRPCYGEQCPDWNACKPTMTLLVILPRITWLGVYQIQTSSWRSIRQISEQLEFVSRMNGGKISMVPFKLTREEQQVGYYDQKAGQEKYSVHHLLHLRPNERFFENYGDEVKQVAGRLQGFQLELPSAEEIVTAPMEDYYPTVEEGSPEHREVEGEAAVQQTLSKAEEVVKDPEVSALFDQLGKLKGTTWGEKQRLIAVRKKENEPDVKAAVMVQLQSLIAQEREKQAKSGDQAQPASEPKPVQQAAAPPKEGEVVDSDGIL